MIDPADALAGAHAVGWATVDFDRAVHDLGPLLRPGSHFHEAPSSSILGARCMVGDARGPGAPIVVLLEPATEGRLAGALARFGEGWVATWFHAPPGDMDDVAVPGPLGLEWFDRAAPSGGPYRLLLLPATIEP